jgi:uncharacterized protein YkwD
MVRGLLSYLRAFIQLGEVMHLQRGLVSIFIVVGALAACAPAHKRPEPAPSAPARPQAPAPVPPPESLAPVPPGATSVKVNSLEQKILDATNAFRKENGLPPLKPTVRLLSIAQSHARNMARQDKYGDSDQNGHVLDGQGLDYRIKVGGYAFSRVAENVGYQLRRSGPADAMMEGWKKSPGHRKNMLLPDITELGVGAAQGKSARWYFVQVFGRPDTPPRRQALIHQARSKGV